jgi:hypothetical protein
MVKATASISTPFGWVKLEKLPPSKTLIKGVVYKMV